MTGFIEQLRCTLDMFRWRTIKGYYRHGISGSKYGGYYAGTLARRRAVAKRIRKLQARIDAYDAELQRIDAELNESPNSDDYAK